MREQVYVIADNGLLKIQSRSVPLPTAIKFVVGQANIICPDLTVDFVITGWSDLGQAIDVRNRVTHPRSDNDLNVRDRDLKVVASGLSWMVATTEYVVASTHMALVRHADLVRDVVSRLIGGDPDALAEYQAVIDRTD